MTATLLFYQLPKMVTPSPIECCPDDELSGPSNTKSMTPIVQPSTESIERLKYN